MTVTISKWRNSQGFCLPKNIMKDLHLAIEDLVSQIPTECKLTEEFISILWAKQSGRLYSPKR